jgi:hypothetical protein
MNQTLADFAFDRPLKPRPEVALSAFSLLLTDINGEKEEGKTNTHTFVSYPPRGW